MLNTITGLLYPRACLLCHGFLDVDTDLFCPGCQEGLAARPRPVCERCGAGLSGAYDAVLRCAACRRRPPAFTQARAPFAYTPDVRNAVHAFKYDGRAKVGAWLAQQMARTAEAHFPLSRLGRIVSVPMHWLKRRAKGMDPAAFLAQRVAGHLGLPYDPALLRRVRWTPSQTRLTPARRRTNVRGAFRLHGVLEPGSAVLVVDDVLTSGATADECARTLTAAGAGQVFVLTAARAQLA